MKKIISTSLLIVMSVFLYSFSNDQGLQDDKIIGLNVGNKAPEIRLKNPEGKEMSLSSLKGKMVLIDFWASWCGPCRMENPHVVQAYNKYKSAKFKSAKGFEVYSVSLDKDRGRWISAIKQDKLEWPNHVSDLKFWSSEAAKLYNVNSIPTNWLIDENGIIVAKNLRGNQLHIAIDNYVENLGK